MPSLTKYRKKRDFERTQEPRGTRARAKKVAEPAPAFGFVVQKHDARASSEGKGWHLFKSRDAEARQRDTLLDEETTSALTERSLGQIQRGDPEVTQPFAKPATLPKTLSPELATLVDVAPAGDAWVHEIKLDGYRILARLEHGEVQLLTRNGHDWTDRLRWLAKALQKLKVQTAFIDGELVALDERGISNFQQLQNALSGQGHDSLVYYAFDLMHLDGQELAPLPLVERKARLRQLLERDADDVGQTLRLSAHIVGSGPDFFDSACKLGLEGTIAKRADSPYRGGRGRDWLKIKCTRRQEFAIVGFTEPAGSRSHLGALLLGVAEQGELRYAGRVGTGFSEASLRELQAKLAPLSTTKSALVNPPRGADARGVHWVEPVLVAEVGFSEMTGEGMLRHPRFYGLREDKQGHEAKLDKPTRVEAGPTRGYPLTNPDKVLYPEQGITKRELLEYYGLVAERMLPHVRNRPLTLVRCPDGHHKSCFFQKHPGAGAPPGLRSIDIREKDGKAPYSVIDDAEGLFGLVQLGALEIHTWGSRADDFEHPDILVFDLDPDPAVDYQQVIAAALSLRKIFEQAKLETFVKTTGGKGLHVCVPIAPELDWEQAKDFTGRLASAMAQSAPQLYVATASKAKRKGKIFVDYLRNGRGATFIAPYSTRARENAPLAIPLEWDELSPRLPPNHFTLRNVAKRLTRLRADPFARLAQLEQRLRPESVDTPPPPKTSPRKGK